MTCREADRLICEYIDGALPFEQRRDFEKHVAECPTCSETLADSEFALGVMRKTPGVQAPIELIADIIHETIGVRGTMPVLAPVGGPVEAGLFGWLRPLFNPLLQPRFAMSMVMAVLSLSMLTFYAKGALDNWNPNKSNPTAVVERIGSQFKRAWDATAEFFQTVQGMYQLQKEYGREPQGVEKDAVPPAEPSGPPVGEPAAPSVAEPAVQAPAGSSTAPQPPGPAANPGRPGASATRPPAGR